MKYILASGSPRRKELLKLVVPEFEVMVSNIDEKLKDGLTPREQAKSLAYQKAKDVFEKTEGNRIVIGSDTIVVKDNKIYGKPKDEQDAKNMIKELISGDRSHSVVTGLSIMAQIDGRTEKYKVSDETKIYLTDISDKEIDKWIATGKAMDKAGAYAIQEEFAVFVEKIEGNYDTVVGLPVYQVYNILKLIELT